mmetsp:Transcript_12105/g.37558  ORF Transcript_12105/g.37558 Transcript_12105/m.37558 type:complete len:102 (+) Transcript_12105:407-712(+)
MATPHARGPQAHVAAAEARGRAAGLVEGVIVAASTAAWGASIADAVLAAEGATKAPTASKRAAAKSTCARQSIATTVLQVQLDTCRPADTPSAPAMQLFQA